MRQQRLAEMIISKLHTNLDDPCTVINEFLYWDTTTMAFARHRAIKMQDVLGKIKTSKSRASGFFRDEIDTEIEHWLYFIQEDDEKDDLVMQAVNCSVCGNYIYSNTLVNYMFTTNAKIGIQSFHAWMLQSNLHTIYCKCDN